jgi:hypothetical protein
VDVNGSRSNSVVLKISKINFTFFVNKKLNIISISSSVLDPCHFGTDPDPHQ